MLIRAGVLSCSAYLAANRQRFRERLARLFQVAATAPFSGVLRRHNRTLANRLLYWAFRGMSEDRVAILGQEYFDEILKEQLSSEALNLVQKARKEGHRIVLVSEGISFVVEALADYIKGVNHVLCNRLEFGNSVATGRLLPPVVGGFETARAISQFADEIGIDLSRSMAYAGQSSDLFFLSAVGKPCAVNPDFSLRQAAREANWPILEHRA